MRFTAIYVRQSADRADSVSLETQEQLCRQDTAPDETVTVYRDRGYSGKNTDRPALQEMMAAAAANQIGRVLVYKLDRISRNLADFTQLLRVFQAYQIEFCSHTERFETASPMGQAMQSLLMVFAQLERETISGRVRDAAFSRAKIGFDTGGPPPIGFCKVPAVLMGKRTLMLQPDAHADFVRAGFSQYLAADYSLADLCRSWNALGFYTARGKNWSANTVCRVLRNPVYAQANGDVYARLASLGAEVCAADPLPEDHGVYLYTDRRVNRSRFTDLHGTLAITAPHIGLIPPQIWLACQEKLDASRKKRSTGTGQKSWLSGTLFCMRCGCAMTVTQGRSCAYFICGGKKRGVCEGAGAVRRVPETEAAVGAVLRVYLEMLRQYGEAAVLRNTQHENLRQELETLTLRRERLLQAMTERDDIEIAEIAAAAARLKARCSVIAEQLSACRVYREARLPDWDACGFSARKTIAQKLLRCIMAEGTVLHLFFR